MADYNESWGISFFRLQISAYLYLHLIDPTTYVTGTVEPKNKYVRVKGRNFGGEKEGVRR